jgi:hypothetical protein
MSILDELDEAGDTGPHSRKGLSVLDELTGLDKDDEADKAEEETRQQAAEELGQEALMAIKGNDAKALYKALADILANEGA